MTVTDVSALVDRAERAIAKIEIVSEAIQRCQAHCWVGEDRRKEWRRRGVTFLVAAAGAFCGSWLVR